MTGCGAEGSDTELGARILKVNHAGEHGAVNIYAGQIAMARFTAPALLDELRRFQADELRHRALFGAELERRRRRRCRSYRLCGIGGWASSPACSASVRSLRRPLRWNASYCGI